MKSCYIIHNNNFVKIFTQLLICFINRYRDPYASTCDVKYTYINNRGQYLIFLTYDIPVTYILRIGDVYAHKRLYIHIARYIKDRFYIDHVRERTRAKRRREESIRVYLCNKAAADSPVFIGKFHFLSTNIRLKGTNIGFGYYIFDLRPILQSLSIYLRVTNCTREIDSVRLPHKHTQLFSLHMKQIYTSIALPT